MSILNNPASSRRYGMVDRTGPEMHSDERTNDVGMEATVESETVASVPAIGRTNREEFDLLKQPKQILCHLRDPAGNPIQ